MTMFDDQPSARDVLRQRQAQAAEDLQHASSAANGKHMGDEATECSPSTPEQRLQDANELGFPESRRKAGGQSSSRLVQHATMHNLSSQKQGWDHVNEQHSFHSRVMNGLGT